MFARVSRYEAPADQVDQAIQGFEAATGSLRQMEGIQRAYLLVDRTSGKALTITVWDSEESMRATEQAANQLRSQAMGASGGSVLEVESYEVVTQEDFT